LEVNLSGLNVSLTVPEVAIICSAIRNNKGVATGINYTALAEQLSKVSGYERHWLSGTDNEIRRQKESLYRLAVKYRDDSGVEGAVGEARH
jgi:hypothetical protein